LGGSATAKAICLLAIFIVGLVQAAIDETVLVIALIRYGNITPESGLGITKYGDNPPKYLYSERLILTEVGKRQMFLMGKYYKEKYPALLGDNLKNNDITVISSDNSRTVMAAHAFLLGLSEDTDTLETDLGDPRLSPKFKPKIKNLSLEVPNLYTPIPAGWNTITIQTTSAENDTLLNLNSKEVCPNRNLILSRREKQRLEKYLNATEAMNTVANIYGISRDKINYTDLIYCYSLFSLVQSDYYRRNKPIINKTGQYADVYKTLSNCSAASLIATYGSDKDVITDASNLFINITKILSNFIARDMNPIRDLKSKLKKRKFVVYSAHKKSFFPAMVILGMSSRKCVENEYRGLPLPENQKCLEFPHSGTHISFEVVRRKSTETSTDYTYWVRTYFKEMPVTLPNQNSTLIPSEEFLKFINSSINLSWEADCGLFPPSKLIVDSQQWLVLLIISNAALFLIISFIFWYMWRRSSSKSDANVDDSQNYSIIIGHV
jgi:hypothetical protein